MKTGTKSLLFGVHQFIIHPTLVLRAWRILFQRWPKFHELVAIITHDWGYWGAPSMDGPRGEKHPEIIAGWWDKYFGPFGRKVAWEIYGHSRYYARQHGLQVSKLFWADKLCITLYPRWLYLLLSNLTGELKEYMERWPGSPLARFCPDKRSTQMHWMLELQAHMVEMCKVGEKHFDVVTEALEPGRNDT